MAKEKEYYYCTECGYKASKWLGKCPECGGWNSFQEEIKLRKSDTTNINIHDAAVYRFNDIKIPKVYRLTTEFAEFDRVLGGGILLGEVVLITGSPGVGKSTLLLQMLKDYSKDGEVLYISGEESVEQIKYRGERLKIESDKISIMSETDIEVISDYVTKKLPKVVVVDSIQTLYSSKFEGIPGTVTQIRESTLRVIEVAKKTGVAFFIVGHITKDGKVAGPKLLEHMVDAVLAFEGEENFSYRILRSTKNRYGSTNEIGIFNMDDIGITEVTNPSEYFLGEREERNIGSTIVPVLEGSRVFLLEIQALTTSAIFGMPRRVVQGLDYNKVQIITAVIEKKLNMNLATMDLFVNVPGGMSIKEPASGLGIATAIISSIKGFGVPKDLMAIGEIGLRGEIRRVSFITKRLKEAEKVGFKRVFIPEGNRKEVESENYNLKIYYLKNLFELLERTNANEK